MHGVRFSDRLLDPIRPLVLVHTIVALQLLDHSTVRPITFALAINFFLTPVQISLKKVLIF